MKPENEIDVATATTNADSVLGAWIAEVDSIEIADRTQYKINSRVSGLIHWESGSVRRIKIDYTLDKI